MSGQLALVVLVATFCGYIFSEHMTRPRMIFNRLYLSAEEWFPWWIHKPLITCFRCVSGQWAFWAYVISCESFHIGWAFACACVGVGFSIILHKILGHEYET